MNIKYFCPRWGSEDLAWPEFCLRVAEAGFDGIETALPLNAEKTEEILAAISGSGLLFIAQHYETVSPDADTHILELLNRLEWLCAAKPLFINSQTGRDFFSPALNRDLMDATQRLSELRNIPIVHETHRSKALFCPSRTELFLKADPTLRITADFSHWCCVSESLLNDQSDAVSLAIERSDHIHARVGYAQGPQCADPFAPESEEALLAHLGWWDRILEAHKGTMTVTLECGPWPYMHCLPYTREPLASQWDINTRMMNLLKARWSSAREIETIQA